MFLKSNVIRLIFILFITSSLIACGGGSPGNESPGDPGNFGTVTGVAILGPIANGEVTAYPFVTNLITDPFNTVPARTSADGRYSLNLNIKSQAIFICVANGNYIEPASVASKVVNFNSVDRMCAITNYKTGVTQKIAITYFTHLAYSYALSLIEQGMSELSAIEQANTAISNWLGVDILQTEPLDITNVLNADSQLTAGLKYGFANAAVSSLMLELSTAVFANEFSVITSINYLHSSYSDVIVDGRLDGKKSVVAGGIVEIAGISLNKSIYRDQLANNITIMAFSIRNKSTITAAKNELINFQTKIKNYSGSIFMP